MLSQKEMICLKKTSLRNLKRRYAKLKEHPEFTDECILLKKEINSLEKELA